MFIIKNWKKEILTIPNLLSFLRLMLIPVYVTVYLRAGDDPLMHLMAAIILGLSCLTDLADGFIARHYRMCSTVGKILDPLADKTTQLALMLCLAAKYSVFRYVVLLFLVKELFQLTAGIVFLRRGKILTGALIPGKICTAVLFLSLLLMVLLPRVTQETAAILGATDCVFLGVSFAGYFQAYFGKNAKLHDFIDIENPPDFRRA